MTISVSVVVNTKCHKSAWTKTANKIAIELVKNKEEISRHTEIIIVKTRNYENTID